MRKTVMFLAATAALLVLVAGAALASGTGMKNAIISTDKAGQEIQCIGIPCSGTGSDDLIYERKGNRVRDRILLKGGYDKVYANTYRHDKDVIKGSAGLDVIYVDDGDTKDKIFGGRGNDRCYVDAASEVIKGCHRTIIVNPN